MLTSERKRGPEFTTVFLLAEERPVETCDPVSLNDPWVSKWLRTSVGSPLYSSVFLSHSARSSSAQFNLNISFAPFSRSPVNSLLRCSLLGFSYAPASASSVAGTTDSGCHQTQVGRVETGSSYVVQVDLELLLHHRQSQILGLSNTCLLVQLLEFS